MAGRRNNGNAGDLFYRAGLPSGMSAVICRAGLPSGITMGMPPCGRPCLLPQGGIPIIITAGNHSGHQSGIQHAITYDLEDGLTIRLLSLPYFLATKFAAYHSRGSDPRTSHDFEDIIYLTDNCTNLVAAIRDADRAVRNFLKSEFEKIWTNPYRGEIVGCHLQPWNVDARFKIVSEKITAIVSM